MSWGSIVSNHMLKNYNSCEYCVISMLWRHLIWSFQGHVVCFNGILCIWSLYCIFCCGILWYCVLEGISSYPQFLIISIEINEMMSTTRLHCGILYFCHFFYIRRIYTRKKNIEKIEIISFSRSLSLIS